MAVDVVGSGKSRTFHFEVLDDRQLTPSAMLSSVYQTLQGTNQAAAEQSYLLTGELSVAGQPTVKLRGMMAPTGNTGAINVALYINDRFSKVYENAAEQPKVTGLTLRMEAQPTRRTAGLEVARLSKVEARAGETVEIEVTVHPYQAAAQVIRVPITLPASLASGTMRLVVSDGGVLDRLMSSPGPGTRAVSLGDTVAAMNRAHSNDRVYVTLLEHTAEAVLESGALPAIPLSMANVLEPLKGDQQMQLTGESVMELGSAATGYAISGSFVLRLTVR